MVQTLRIICAIAVMVTIAIMVKVGDLSDGPLVAIFLIFVAVVNAPYALGWIFAGSLRGHEAGLVILALGIVGAAAFGLYAYYVTFFSDRPKDAQDALVFVVLPVYQSCGIIAAYLLAKVVSRFR